jgi:hypothetical protein
LPYCAINAYLAFALISCLDLIFTISFQLMQIAAKDYMLQFQLFAQYQHVGSFSNSY